MENEKATHEYLRLLQAAINFSYAGKLVLSVKNITDVCRHDTMKTLWAASIKKLRQANAINKKYKLGYEHINLKFNERGTELFIYIDEIESIAYMYYAKCISMNREKDILF